MKSISIVLTAALAALACAEPNLPVAQDFELERFQGHWYEVSRIPRHYDELCHDTTADYTLMDRQRLQVVHACRLGSASGTERRVIAGARITEPDQPAKLTLTIGSYAGDYWVLDVSEDYDLAVVGHPSRLMLWVLSRSPQVEPDRLAAVRRLVDDLGFNPDLLVPTPHSTELH